MALKGFSNTARYRVNTWTSEGFSGGKKIPFPTVVSSGTSNMNRSSLLTCVFPIVVVLSIQGFLLLGRTTLHCSAEEAACLGHSPPAGAITTGRDPLLSTCPARLRGPARCCPLRNGLCWGRGGRVDASSTWSPRSFPPLPPRPVLVCLLQWLLDLADHLCHPDTGTEHPPPRTWLADAGVAACLKSAHVTVTPVRFSCRWFT